MAKIGFLMSTNRPEMAIDQFIPSLDYLSSMRKDSIFLVNFQSPWNKKSIAEFSALIKEKGFKMKSKQTPVHKSGDVPFIALRESAFSLDRSCKYYGLIDDDMVFSGKGTPKYKRNSGERYLDCIQYLDAFHACGAVMCDGYLGGDVQGESIAPAMNVLIATCKGLFFRNLRQPTLLPSSWSKLRGALEETAIVYNSISRGFYLAKQFNNPTIHKADTPRVFLDVTEKIRATWEEEKWNHNVGRFPAKLLDDFVKNTLDPSAYYPMLLCCQTRFTPQKNWKFCPTCGKAFDIKAYWQ
jgi:hypothetical protein